MTDLQMMFGAKLHVDAAWMVDLRRFFVTSNEWMDKCGLCW